MIGVVCRAGVFQMVGKRQIVIAQRGFVFVGTVKKETPDRLVLTDSAVIRRWGTERGLGQLAAEGKQVETKLDACGEVTLHPLAVVARIDVKKGVTLAD